MTFTHSYYHIFSDGGYIVIGETAEGLNQKGYPYGLEAWLIKIEPEIGTDEGFWIQDKKYGLAVIPNPSGNKANIKYIIQNTENRTQDVKILVYDMAGRTIETLVSEKKEAGSYDIDFHSKRGIYFVELVAGNYKETKKLILL